MWIAILTILTLPAALTVAFSLQRWGPYERTSSFVTAGLVMQYALMAVLVWWLLGRYLTSIGVAGYGSQIPDTAWWDTLIGRWWLLVGGYVVLGSLSLTFLRRGVSGS